MTQSRSSLKPYKKSANGHITFYRGCAIEEISVAYGGEPDKLYNVVGYVTSCLAERETIYTFVVVENGRLKRYSMV
jgi:hypothetical protein